MYIHSKLSISCSYVDTFNYHAMITYCYVQHEDVAYRMGLSPSGITLHHQSRPNTHYAW